MNGIQEGEGSIPFVSTRKRHVQSKNCTSLILYNKSEIADIQRKREQKTIEERDIGESKKRKGAVSERGSAKELPFFASRRHFKT